MNILITGGAGFIGSHLVDACIDAGHTVCIVDNFSSGLRENISHHDNNARVIICEADITDLSRMDEIFRTFLPEIVFHLAAQINVRESIKNPAKDISINVLWTIHILDLMRKYQCHRIVFSSTWWALFSQDIPPYTEERTPTPETPYGISKYTGEMLLSFYQKQYGIAGTILRYANVYWPRQNPQGEAGVISIFLEKIQNQKAPTIYGNGTQTRDFVHVFDVVAANMHVFHKNLIWTYHVGTGKETSVNEVWNLLGSTSALTPTYSPALGEIQRSALDSRKLQETGWIIRYPHITL